MSTTKTASGLLHREEVTYRVLVLVVGEDVFLFSIYPHGSAAIRDGACRALIDAAMRYPHD